MLDYNISELQRLVSNMIEFDTIEDKNDFINTMSFAGVSEKHAIKLFNEINMMSEYEKQDKLTKDYEFFIWYVDTFSE